MTSILTKSFFFSFSLLFLSISVQAQEEFGTGCILDSAAYNKVPLSATLMRGDFLNLPRFASLRMYAPIPKNQGSYGTCVGWTTAYSARTILLAHQKNWTNSITVTQNALSPFFVYERTKPSYDTDCQEGTTLSKALEDMKNIGVVKYSDFQEICGKTITFFHKEKAKEFKITDYKRLFESSAPNKVQLIKKSLSENKPVMMGIECCRPSFLNAKGVDYWKPQANEPRPSGGHAVTVVAYDDLKYGGAFQIMNSWGTSWGNQGFIWISYQDFDAMSFEGYEMSVEEVMEEQKDIFVDLSGSLKFTLSAGYPMQADYKGNYYEMKESYYSGTLFRLHISNNEPAYVYAFGSDMSKKNYKIFPNQENISPYLGYKSNNIALPNEDKYIKMDKKIGVDYFCVLYSKDKLDIDAIIEEMEYKEGDFYTRLKQVVGDKLIDPANIIYKSNGEIGFEGSGINKTIVPIIVSINHL